MARNQEKAQTMLARWLRYKEEQVKGPKKRRPYLAELCEDLHEAEKWRGTIIRDISKNVSEIQNASLGEHRIRDLNDRINKLFREKRHWERRIKVLGGKDYKYSSRGFGGYGHGAYVYFGAAKDLPGVRELVSSNREDGIGTISAQQKNKKYVNKDRVTQKEKISRSEMYQRIDASYYGFGDDDDDDLFWKEKEMEQKLRKNKIDKWNQEHASDKQRHHHNNALAAHMFGADSDDISEKKKKLRMSRISSGYVPSQEEIDQAILQKRKELLLKKYAQGDSEDARQLAKNVRKQQQKKSESKQEA